ncbi:uncharacterized protein [Parasteatoda tepidariorum]|uniref:uncharacterized protein isoform X2 n=1 Tax=Parasteatoda tepidariorum TaxID=114398 RepID=UPI00077F8D4F|nr:uncharacterized protein LOC107449276 isoform X1 [Parasteatoda tepidariorum]
MPSHKFVLSCLLAIALCFCLNIQSALTHSFSPNALCGIHCSEFGRPPPELTDCKCSKRLMDTSGRKRSDTSAGNMDKAASELLLRYLKEASRKIDDKEGLKDFGGEREFETEVDYL